jgi:serine/threonine protein kinase
MIVGNKYKIINKMGEGNFGTIFKGCNIRTGEEVAIKTEPLDSVSSILKKEAQIYQYIGKTAGFPQVKWFGVDDTNRYMVIDLLGESINEQIRRDGKMPLRKALQIGEQMIDRIEALHGKKMIHRDIKPDNFLFGRGPNKDILYLIDFGFSKPFEDENGTHIKERNNRSLIGTPNFVSVRVKNGIEPSRRDDLESIIYVIMFMVKNEDQANEVFSVLLCYISQLEFSETPDYDYIKKIFNKYKLAEICYKLELF